MGMIGVSFFESDRHFAIHSFDDWHVLYNGSRKEYPAPQRITVDVALRHGLLDVTSALTDGIIFYENRKITIDFVVVDNPLPWPELYSKIASDIHGKKMYFIFDTDPNFYWRAYNCTISTPDSDEDIGKFSIECDCYPFKREIEPQSIAFSMVDYWQWGVSNEILVSKIIENLRENVIPTIITDQAMTVLFEGNEYSMSVGENNNENIILKPGSNSLSFYCVANSNGTNIPTDVEIRFRRGEL